MQVLSYIPANLQSMEITGEAPLQTDGLVAKITHWLKPIDSGSWMLDTGSWINNLRSLSVIQHQEASIQHQFALCIMCDTKTEPKISGLGVKKTLKKKAENPA